jgi:peptidoglycan/LPS O-acetylase OafA/YrhL
MTHARVNEIDLLRFLAALSVVFYHYTFRGYAADDLSAMPYPLLAPAAKYGYLGVELFFMISGFVVLMTAAASRRLRDFCISRMVRLYPAYWACCTITFVLVAAWGAPRHTATIDQYLMNMTMLSGLSKYQPIDGAYWSLLVEIRFYALVAVVLAIGRIHQAQRFLAIWLLATAALELLPMLAAPMGWVPPDALRYLRFLLIVNYAAYFVAGAACYLVWSQGASIGRLALIAASWGLALFQAGPGLREFETYYQTTVNTNIVFSIITLFFLGMLLVSLRRTGSLARHRWPLAGALSYPVYLLHQNIGYIIFNRFYPAIDPHALLWGTVILVLAAAYAVHVLVERRLSSRMKMALTATLNRRADVQL